MLVSNNINSTTIENSHKIALNCYGDNDIHICKKRRSTEELDQL